MLQFHCPSCNRSLKAAEDKAGRKFPCPTCKSPVQVPVPPIPADDDSIEYATLEMEPPPPRIGRRTKKPATKTSDIETEPCTNCGETTIFPVGAAGQTDECANCGQALTVPTVKQYAYRVREEKTRVREQKTTRRFFGCAVIAIVLFTGAIIAILLLADYRRSKTPVGAAETAWYAQNSHRKNMSITAAYAEASHGDITIVSLSAHVSITGGDRRRHKEAGIDLDDFSNPTEFYFVVMRGLTLIEIFSADKVTIDELKRKFMPNMREGNK